MTHGSNGKLSAKVLILNQNYEPMSVINVKKAIVLLYLGKAELIAANDGKRVRSVSMSMPFPSIVRLSVYVKVPFKKIILSRKNILRRDGHRCQYCGRTEVALTIDHLMPVSRGGEDTWENLVCACVDCNNRERRPHRGRSADAAASPPDPPEPCDLHPSLRRSPGRTVEAVSLFELTRPPRGRDVHDFHRNSALRHP